LSSRQEQGKARTANISGKRDHGKAIETGAPGAARDAGETGTGRPAALGGPGILYWIQENVSTKLSADNLNEVEDDHIFAFHEVYAICTCHLILPTKWAGTSTDKPCACMCVPDETVLKECQRLKLLGCIPHICGHAWHRVALAHHQTLKN